MYQDTETSARSSSTDSRVDQISTIEPKEDRYRNSYSSKSLKNSREFNIDEYFVTRSKRSTDTCYESYHSSAILHQPENCAERSISAEAYGDIVARNICVIATQKMYFPVPNRDPMVYYSPGGFACLTCLPINCGDIENLNHNCSKYATKSRYPLIYVNKFKRIIINIHYDCVTECGDPPTRRSIQQATILHNGTLRYI